MPTRWVGWDLKTQLCWTAQGGACPCAGDPERHYAYQSRREARKLLRESGIINVPLEWWE